MVQQIFILVPRLNPSLRFLTAQEIWSTENTNNNDKKQRWNLDSGAFRPRVKTRFVGCLGVGSKHMFILAFLLAVARLLAVCCGNDSI